MMRFEFYADAADRLRALMEHQNIDFRHRLKQSAATAGWLLELAKPSVMGDSKHGRLYAGPAVMVPVGTVIIVLATPRKVLPIWLRPAAGTLADSVEETVAYIEAAVEAEGDVPFAGNEALFVADHLVNSYGRRPGKPGVEVANEHNARIVGMMFAALPATERAHMIKGLETAIAQGICPVMVCLLGRRQQDRHVRGLAAVSPLAPYADAVLAGDAA